MAEGVLDTTVEAIRRQLGRIAETFGLAGKSTTEQAQIASQKVVAASTVSTPVYAAATTPTDKTKQQKKLASNTP